MIKIKLPISILFGIALLISLSSSLAFANSTIGDEMDLPAGWTSVVQSESLGKTTSRKGSFQINSKLLRAQVVKHNLSGEYGVAVLNVKNKAMEIFAKFKNVDTDPAELYLMEPGKYQPICSRRKNACAPIILRTKSIGICFGETSCRLIYYRERKFHEIYLTD